MKKNISHEELFDLSSYDYELPSECIAQFPADPRDSSRLLVWEAASGKVDFENHFCDIKNFLHPGDLLILNDTRVIPARLKGIRETGGKAEIFLLSPLNHDYLIWEALVKPGRKIHDGSRIKVAECFLKVEESKHEHEKNEGIRTVCFEFENEGFSCRDDVISFLEKFGSVPLPPYIKSNEEDMKSAYQTVFARNEGSVAAPTASLHFTPELLNEIKALGVNIAWVTLHVGLGTFRPVKSQDIRKHVIHEEHCEVPEATAQAIHKCRVNGGRVVASGTTAARTLESFSNNEQPGEVSSGILKTSLYIYPGFKFQIVDALITNFHLPKSSLIMLVAAFAANRANVDGHEEKLLTQLLEIYECAAHKGWRFFSFGDAMIIL